MLVLDLFVVLRRFNRKGHIATGSLRVEEPVHTSWSRFLHLRCWALVDVVLLLSSNIAPLKLNIYLPL